MYIVRKIVEKVKDIRSGLLHRAGALYYAILISLLITILTGFILVFNFYSSKLVGTSGKLDQVISDIYSAFDLLMDSEIEPGTSTLDLYNDSTSVVDVYTEQWGAYYIITVESENEAYPLGKTAMIGFKDDSGDMTCLYLQDQKNNLSVTGNTSITGDVYLPESGIKPIVIEGRNYTGKSLVKGKINKSLSRLPEINKDLFDDPETDDYETFYFSEYNPGDTIYNSFKNDMMVFEAKKPLADLVIIGKILIHSDEKIVVTKDCILEDVILIAPEIFVDEGFKGRFQAFATDSIRVSKDAELSYPSFLMLHVDNSLHGEINIEESAKISGGVCLYKEADLTIPHSVINIAEDAEISGIVYSNDMVELKGTVKGRVYTSKFILRTASSAYENLLMDAVITMESYNEYFVEPVIFKSQKFELLKWVN